MCLCQDHVEMAFEYPQGGRLHSLFGQPVVVLSNGVKKCSESVPCVSVCACHLLFCHQALLKRTWLYLFSTLPSGFYVHW